MQLKAASATNTGRCRIFKIIGENNALLQKKNTHVSCQNMRLSGKNRSDGLVGRVAGLATGG
jgi:hypothetical protein